MFSTVAAPLNRLTCKNVRFEWGPEQQRAFDALKSALCQSPVLTTPDPVGQYVLDTDASNDGLGAVLAQITTKRASDRYYSRTFSKPERNFVIRTDHASLRWLMSFREQEGQVARWIEQLQEYNFSVVHRQGDSHTNADGLSRRPCGPDCAHCSRAEAKDTEAGRQRTESCMALRLDDTKDWAREQQGDPELSTVLGWLEANQ